MKKSYIIIFILVILALVISFFILSNTSSKKNNNNITENYQADKTLATKNDVSNEKENVTIDTNNSPENNVTIQTPVVATSPVETEISVFSTKIHNKDSERQNNITITCSALNNTEIQPGSTFSFCNTIGKSTSNKGYQEADVFTSDGEVTKGLGGGNCQVSTTLYNAVLAVPELTVTERHEHSGNVPYIDEGKDAAISYGSYDLKFVNNSANTIKIIATNTSSYVTIKLLKIT